MNNKEDAEIGQVVYLRPATKTASLWCHQRREARIVSYDEWPIVKVGIGAAVDYQVIRVHRMDIALNKARTKVDRSEGDATRDSKEGESLWRIPKPLLKPHPESPDQIPLW
jgi:hypothetical protein